VEAIHAVVGKRIGYEDGGVRADYSDVGKGPSPDPVHGVAVVFSRAFDAQKINVWPGLGFVEQEGALARTNFDVNGTSASENLDKIYLTIQIFRPKRDLRIIP
jgi:hypothetical protein